MEKRSRCKRGTRWNKRTVKCESTKNTNVNPPKISHVSPEVKSVKQKRCSTGSRRNKTTGECVKIKQTPVKQTAPVQKYDIIIGVYLHGATTTHCPYKHKPNFANATLIEAIPCGTYNYVLNEHKELIEELINKYHALDNTELTHKLQTDLRKHKMDSVADRLKYIPNAYDSPGHADYKAQEGWRIMNNGYLERKYEADTTRKKKGEQISKLRIKLNQIVVHYESGSRKFKKGQNIYLKHKVKNRTELMELLKDFGYANPLIIDCSCGSWAEELGFDTPTRKDKKKIAESLGVAGGY